MGITMKVTKYIVFLSALIFVHGNGTGPNTTDKNEVSDQNGTGARSFLTPIQNTNGGSSSSWKISSSSSSGGGGGGSSSSASSSGLGGMSASKLYEDSAFNVNVPARTLSLDGIYKSPKYEGSWMNGGQSSKINGGSSIIDLPMVSSISSSFMKPSYITGSVKPQISFTQTGGSDSFADYSPSQISSVIRPSFKLISRPSGNGPNVFDLSSVNGVNNLQDMIQYLPPTLLPPNTIQPPNNGPDSVLYDFIQSVTKQSPEYNPYQQPQYNQINDGIIPISRPIPLYDSASSQLFPGQEIRIPNNGFSTVNGVLRIPNKMHDMIKYYTIPKPGKITGFPETSMNNVPSSLIDSILNKLSNSNANSETVGNTEPSLQDLLYPTPAPSYGINGLPNLGGSINGIPSYGNIFINGGSTLPSVVSSNTLPSAFGSGNGYTVSSNTLPSVVSGSNNGYTISGSSLPRLVAATPWPLNSNAQPSAFGSNNGYTFTSSNAIPSVVSGSNNGYTFTSSNTLLPSIVSSNNGYQKLPLYDTSSGGPSTQMQYIQSTGGKMPSVMQVGPKGQYSYSSSSFQQPLSVSYSSYGRGSSGSPVMRSMDSGVTFYN